MISMTRIAKSVLGLATLAALACSSGCSVLGVEIGRSLDRGSARWITHDQLGAAAIDLRAPVIVWLSSGTGVEAHFGRLRCEADTTVEVVVRAGATERFESYPLREVQAVELKSTGMATRMFLGGLALDAAAIHLLVRAWNR